MAALTGTKLAGAELEVVGYVSAPTSCFARSIAFYRRVFAFCVVEDGRDQHYPYVFMRSPGEMYLALYARAHGNEQQVQCFSLIVDDLDRVRADLWDMGVPLADGSIEPRRRYPWYPGRSLLIRDPDGHEIELVERCRQSPADR